MKSITTSKHNIWMVALFGVLTFNISFMSSLFPTQSPSKFGTTELASKGTLRATVRSCIGKTKGSYEQEVKINGKTIKGTLNCSYTKKDITEHKDTGKGITTKTYKNEEVKIVTWTPSMESDCKSCYTINLNPYRLKGSSFDEIAKLASDDIFTQLQSMGKKEVQAKKDDEEAKKKAKKEKR